MKKWCFCSLCHRQHNDGYATGTPTQLIDDEADTSECWICGSSHTFKDHKFSNVVVVDIPQGVLPLWKNTKEEM